MTPDDFVLWLQGVSDVLGDEPPSPERWARIREQLRNVRPALPAPAWPPSYPVPDLPRPFYTPPGSPLPSEWWTPIVACSNKANGSC